jgi:hypothetical protein
MVYATAAVAVAYPEPDALFIDSPVYNFDRHDVLGTCAWYTGQFEAGCVFHLRLFFAFELGVYTIESIFCSI